MSSLDWIALSVIAVMALSAVALLAYGTGARIRRYVTYGYLLLGAACLLVALYAATIEV